MACRSPLFSSATDRLYSLAWDGAAVIDFGSVLDVGERILGTGWNAYGDVFVTTVDAPVNGPISNRLVYQVDPGA